jgi:flagellar biosynthesis/type III secretory pathway chaperone
MSALTAPQTEALETVLRGLLREHESLIKLASQHRDALRNADAGEISRISSERAAVIARIASLDKQRAEIVCELAKNLDLHGAGVTVRALIAQIGGHAATQLSALAEKLRAIIERARTEQAAIRDATATVAGHLGGVLTQVVRTCSVGQTYTARGKMNAGSALPASIDFKH